MDEKTILAVDDTPEILESLNGILGDDYDMRLAKTASAAWTALRLIEVNLILLDIEMPGMSGLDFLETINTTRIEYKNIPVIFISSTADQKIIDKALGMGAAGYIVKPFLPEQLHETIKSVLEMANLQNTNMDLSE
ncbi:MAG: response regulator [Treponema sp.]|jgi:DNA-binding NtrC family response regulator|nr:response regulator [Treponema sp.]